ncbi:MAG: hypothetical protein LAO06_21635 [Acidobacteriia bacterium]|nr:hypothetical protein [Terriglobia bacterium]
MSAEFKHGVAHLFWELVERAGAVVWVRMFAPDGRTYLVRLSCEKYGEEPIDGKFVDESTRACVESAWPTGNAVFEQWIKFKAGNLFICWDQDAGGIGHHQDWRPRRAWQKNEIQIVAYLNFLREMLHLPARGYDRRPTSAQG